MGQTSAQRVRSYRERRKANGEPDVTRANAKQRYKKWYDTHNMDRRLNTPFIGCDGEGAGVDHLGRQNYMLFRMGNRELFTGRPLGTYEILDFICDEPSGSILVGFAFGYDVTMILRDLSEERQRRLLAPRVFGEGKSPFTWWQDFDIDYLPRQFLRVRRIRRYTDDEGIERREAVKGTTRTIWETFGFFQKSFAKCLESFAVGTPELRASIAATKGRRGNVDWTITDLEREYCGMECDMLAELMNKLRQYCADADIHPRSWSGAGKLAEALHKKHGTLRAPKKIEEMLWPQPVDDWANIAYYGGRFEITKVGLIKNPVYEYDICSAYPAAMRGLPCLVHGAWNYSDSRSLPDAEIYVADIEYTRRLWADIPGSLNGFPCRSKKGSLVWPRSSSGVYWSYEIRSAVELGHQVKCNGAWVYERRCDCDPFHWVEPLYNYRKSIGSQGAGYPIKLGINSLYGKLAQRKGVGVYNNMIWAGLITSKTRALLNSAIKLAPYDIVMIATDAVYSTAELPLDLGGSLGQWEVTRFDDGLFIVQPGLYWSPDKKKRKSRGLSGRFFEERGRTEAFEQAWDNYMTAQNSQLDVPFPQVPVDFDNFIGLKLALARNKPELAGTWLPSIRAMSFDYTKKRRRQDLCDGHITTYDYVKMARTLPHRDFIALGGADTLDIAKLELQDQPDYIDLGPPWSD
jgi:DNA polymerase type B, organellar and viral